MLFRGILISSARSNAVSESTEERFNRWIIVAGAVLVQFALGAIYSYTFILGAMKSYIDPTKILDDPTRTSLGLLPFAFALLFFSLFFDQVTNSIH